MQCLFYAAFVILAIVLIAVAFAQNVPTGIAAIIIVAGLFIAFKH